MAKTEKTIIPQASPVEPKSSIFDLPSILNIARTGLETYGVVASHLLAQTETQRANAAAETEFWTKYAAQSQQNYRNYEMQLNAWYREADYVERRRQYEEQLAEQQAIFKGAVATTATKNFEKQLADLEGRFYEEEAKETIELENIRAQNIASAAKIAAGGQVGRSVIGMQSAKSQQWLANVSNRQITRNFRIADKIRAGEALNVARENTVNQVQFYTPQPIADPVKPLAPLPITAVAPTPARGPSVSNLTFQLGTVGLDSFLNYQAMQPPAPKAVPGQSQYSGTKPAASAPTTPEESP